jgi:hypothetical protein
VQQPERSARPDQRLIASLQEPTQSGTDRSIMFGLHAPVAERLRDRTAAGGEGPKHGKIIRTQADECGKPIEQLR